MGGIKKEGNGKTKLGGSKAKEPAPKKGLKGGKGEGKTKACKDEPSAPPGTSSSRDSILDEGYGEDEDPSPRAKRATARS